MKRTIKTDKEFVDAYNIQLNRLMRNRDIEDLSEIDKRILKMLLMGYLRYAYFYIYKKHGV